MPGFGCCGGLSCHNSKCLPTQTTTGNQKATSSCIAKAYSFTNNFLLSFSTYSPCSYENILTQIRHRLGRCGHSVEQELQLLTKTSSVDACRTVVNEMCDEATGNKPLNEMVDFSAVDSRFTDSFMKEFIDGKTFLNGKPEDLFCIPFLMYHVFSRSRGIR